MRTLLAIVFALAFIGWFIHETIVGLAELSKIGGAGIAFLAIFWYALWAKLKRDKAL